MCVGTGFVLRRDALAPHGFETGCLSEDVYGGFAVRSRGFQVRYLNEPLAFGAAADSLSEYLPVNIALGAYVVALLTLSALACVDRPKDTHTPVYRQTLRGQWWQAVATLVRGPEGDRPRANHDVG